MLGRRARDNRSSAASRRGAAGGERKLDEAACQARARANLSEELNVRPPPSRSTLFTPGHPIEILDDVKYVSAARRYCVESWDRQRRLARRTRRPRRQ